MREDLEDDLEGSAREYTRESILNGNPLSHLMTLVEEYRNGDITFEKLQGRAGVTLRIHNGISELRQAITDLTAQETASKRKGQLTFEDCMPAKWSPTDLQLGAKIDSFTGFLSRAIKSVNPHNGSSIPES
ncbi:MAG TPA: hypothetical protein VMW29_02875 [Candidatus Bathyarchaeia archaeon]|nr:hypothetical protein [Candidatus Bathyarchaeia archaeon]